MTKDEIRKKFNITGCEHCPHFVSVVVEKGDKPGKKPGWRQYCGKGNFNINQASFRVEKTSHGKNKCVPESNYEWEFAIPNRCPYLKEPADSK